MGQAISSVLELRPLSLFYLLICLYYIMVRQKIINQLLDPDHFLWYVPEAF